MPVVIVEAAFKAVSTAATDVGGISEFISNMNTGILLRQDSSDISRHIVQLIKDPNLLRELSRRSQELAQEKFSVQNLVNEHGNLYKRLVSTG
jgi:glycosyltransferase involved in cell wall biosynthesis